MATNKQQPTDCKHKTRKAQHVTERLDPAEVLLDWEDQVEDHSKFRADCRKNEVPHRQALGQYMGNTQVGI